MPHHLALVACDNYSAPTVESAVTRAVSLLGGLKTWVKPGNLVLLKINLLAASPPEAAVTTHPSIVTAVARLVRAAGGVPVVGDCSGWEGPANARRYMSACRKAGILEACEAEGIEIVHLSADGVEVENPAGRVFRRFTLAKAVLAADVVINLPKLKTHSLTRFTGGVKNLFGCLPGLHKGQFHLRAQSPEDFGQMLADLLSTVRPALTLMDAVVGMEGNGPRSGRPRHVGAIVASADAVAVDAVACSLVGIDPFSVPSLRLAHEQGLGCASLEVISVLGETVSSRQVTPFALPDNQDRRLFSLAGRLLKKRVVARPAFVPDRCRMCWLCVDACPSTALTRGNGRPMLDRDKCIFCYCCQEMCPHDAVVLERPLLARLLS